MNCNEVHLAIGAEPAATSPDLEAHLRECAACAEYRREMLELDAQIHRALKIDLSAVGENVPHADAARSESSARPAVRLISSTPSPLLEKSSWAASLKRQWALAASVLFAIGVALVLWAALPGHTLAADVVQHVIAEPLPADEKPLQPEALAAVLQNAHLRLDPIGGDVLFAQTCFFRGRLVPHFVVRSGGAAVTVLVLSRESVSAPVHFDESGYSGVLFPNPGHGSIAVLSRAQVDSEQEARHILSALHAQPEA
ncbi:MAG TPA: DUF3379 family protein [Steroidobacteraceae bacterium]|jgi:hypothetical protein|nr:DUF3379 family protein [Steroidobacteraceae bacterium]